MGETSERANGYDDNFDINIVAITREDAPYCNCLSCGICGHHKTVLELSIIEAGVSTSTHQTSLCDPCVEDGRRYLYDPDDPLATHSLEEIAEISLNDICERDAYCIRGTPALKIAEAAVRTGWRTCADGEFTPEEILDRWIDEEIAHHKSAVDMWRKELTSAEKRLAAAKKRKRKVQQLLPKGPMRSEESH